MLKAKRIIRTNERVYAAGDILPPFPPAEEERLIALGAVEVVPEPEPVEPADAEASQPVPADTTSKGKAGRKKSK